MGEQSVNLALDSEKLGDFMRFVLRDLKLLEELLDSNKIESGVRRIGAEQELFLVNGNAEPAPIADSVLASIQDSRFTTELAKFNLEANTTPLELTQSCFSMLESELNSLLTMAQNAAALYDGQLLLTGILPTLTLSDLSLSNLTDLPRYRELNRVLTAMRSGNFYVHIKGLDEIFVSHDNMMLEACNTSFQIHYQGDPQRFADQYNLAQAITAPVLAAAVNSPVLFGKRLWCETRLALFQHSVDERSPAIQARYRPARVTFGDRWLEKSVLEIYREDIARFRLLLTGRPEELTADLSDNCSVPELLALRLHNGTIWRWNRPCYGILDGKPHLRIENRALPAGPTIIDEVANAAFFVGLMNGLLDEYGPIHRLMEFESAQQNFYAAARHGLNAQLTWVGGNQSVRDLILNHLLPLARQGLKATQVSSTDVDRYLGVIEERVNSGKTGAQWTLQSVGALKNHRTKQMQCRALTQAMLSNQASGEPVHRWKAVAAAPPDSPAEYRTVEQIMSTDLFTVRPYDLVNLAASIMDWEKIRHIPVEDDDGNLVGLISHRDLLKLLAHSANLDRTASVPVHMIMKQDLLTAAPSMSVLEALQLMRKHQIGCLPVLQNKKLVGILTVYDFLALSATMLERELG
jgi:CBS domain-containing protein/gamma-glutamyl:cysteine ligase YbdK (ATP-grasp superfamily)